MNNNYYPNTNTTNAYPNQTYAPSIMSTEFPLEQSYIENILRLNKGKYAKFYCSFPDSIEWKDKIKVLVSKASPGGDEYPHSIISAPVLAEKNSVCTETYLIVDFVNTEEEGQNLISYMNTRFFRFMMSLIKNTQNISKGVFAFVPVQDFSKPWTDEELYRKYGLTDEEINFINSMIRPMDLGGND